MANEVVLLNTWASPFSIKCRIALAEKGVEYECRTEDLRNKSDLLLKMNPVHTKIPVLIHGGKPVCESNIIVEYIDEVWNDKAPLLPSDPYERAQARFWADFVDKKIYTHGRAMWTHKGAEQQAHKKDLITSLKQLEELALGDNPYFGGDTFGFVDIILIPYYSWFEAYESYGKLKIEDHAPKVVAWGKRCMQRESVSKCVPVQSKVTEFVAELRIRFGIE